MRRVAVLAVLVAAVPLLVGIAACSSGGDDDVDPDVTTDGGLTGIDGPAQVDDSVGANGG